MAYAYHHHYCAPVLRIDNQLKGAVDPLKPREWSHLAVDFERAIDRILNFNAKALKPIGLAYRDALKFRRDSADEEAIAKVINMVNGFEMSFIDHVDSPATARAIDGHLQALSNHNAIDIENTFAKVLGISPKLFDDATKAILGETLTTSVSKIKSIGQQHHAELRSILVKGYVAGTPYPEMADLISERFGVSKSKGHFIAWNEFGNLSGALTQHRQTENGVKRYTWRTSIDERVRPSHAAKEGAVFDWSSPPEDTGHPGFDYRCRCTAEPVLDDLFDDLDDDLLFDPFAEDEPEITIAPIVPEPAPVAIPKPKKPKAPPKPKKPKPLPQAPPEPVPIMPEPEPLVIIPEVPAAPLPAATPIIPVVPDPIPPPIVQAPPIPTPSAGTHVFPESIDGLIDLRGLGGSTGARLVQDPATGVRYVLKRGGSAEHLQEEFLTNQIYRELGANIPESKLYGGTTTLNVFIEGRSIGDLSGEAFERAAAQARKDFAADAFLANWDVAGLSLDNLLVDNAGKVWRIDNGSGLRFRAQGGPKGAAFDEFVTELWSMRDSARNASTARVFGATTIDEIAEQSFNIVAKRQAVLDLIRDPALRRTVEARLDTLADLADTIKDMRDDGWAAAYADNFNRHRQLIAQHGMRKKLPSELTPKSVGPTGAVKDWDPTFLNKEAGTQIPITAFDENGKEWDDLRGPDSIMADFYSYLDTITGTAPRAARQHDHRLLDAAVGELHMVWSSNQASSSWSGAAQGLKYWIAKSRTEAGASYYWRDGVDEARDNLEKFINTLPDPKLAGVNKTREQVFDDAFTAFHALNYETIKKAKIPTKSKDNKSIVLIRTENSSSVLRRYGMESLGARGGVERGPLESASAFTTYYYRGDAVILTRVKTHRVFGNYVMDKGLEQYEKHYGKRLSHYRDHMFAGDHENEIVAIMENSDNITAMVPKYKHGGKTRLSASELSDFINAPLAAPPPVRSAGASNINRASALPAAKVSAATDKISASDPSPIFTSSMGMIPEVQLAIDGEVKKVQYGSFASFLSKQIVAQDESYVVLAMIDDYIPQIKDKALAALDQKQKLVLLSTASEKGGKPTLKSMKDKAKELGWIDNTPAKPKATASKTVNVFGWEASTGNWSKQFGSAAKAQAKLEKLSEYEIDKLTGHTYGELDLIDWHALSKNEKIATLLATEVDVVFPGAAIDLKALAKANLELSYNPPKITSYLGVDKTSVPKPSLKQLTEMTSNEIFNELLDHIPPDILSQVFGALTPDQVISVLITADTPNKSAKFSLSDLIDAKTLLGFN